MGWTIFKFDKKNDTPVDIRDLEQDSIASAQHFLYFLLALLTVYLGPIAVCGYGWGDWKGGLVYAALLRTFLAQETIFSINSVAHAARDNRLVAFLILGEEFHNFHHTFPSDYRNGIEWYQYDPTKWIIYVSHKLGPVSNLQQFRSIEMTKAKIHQQKKVLEEKSWELECGKLIRDPPALSREEFQQLSATKRVVVISGVVYDAENFLDEHPGGKSIIQAHVGKDATAAFHGGVYGHSKVAKSLRRGLRLAVTHGGVRIPDEKIDH